MDVTSWWLFITASIFSSPIGVLTAVATPQFEAWLSLRLTRGMQRRVAALEDMRARVETLIAEPSAAAAFFVTEGVLAILGFILVVVLIEGMLTGPVWSLASTRFARPQLEFHPVSFVLGIATGIIAHIS